MSAEEEVKNNVNVHTWKSYDTEFSADSVEWCPHDPSKNVFVCANYYLTKNDEDSGSNERLGRIFLFSISNDEGIKLIQTLNTEAVLDQKWCHNKINGDSVLGVVTSKKILQIYKLDEETTSLQLITSIQVETDEPELLLLSLDWSTGKYDSQEPNIICSDSKGNIHLFQYCNGKVIVENSWHGHDFEAWIAAFYYWDTNICFSGGDDSIFLKYDRRIGTDPVSKNRIHEAGVTCFHSNSNKEFIVASGSYDSKVRLWDIRTMKRPINTIEMPGTLWRLKWDPFNYDHLLAACMLGGVHILKLTGGTNLEIVASHYEHKKIAYGSDWCFLNDVEVKDFNLIGERIIGTCSFYDHLLCISSVSL